MVSAALRVLDRSTSQYFNMFFRDCTATQPGSWQLTAISDNRTDCNLRSLARCFVGTFVVARSVFVSFVRPLILSWIDFDDRFNAFIQR